MKGGKYAIWVCVLCLSVGFSALAHAQTKSKTSTPSKAATKSSEPSKTEQVNETLIAAVDAEDVSGVQKALSGGANVNGKDREGMTPLMRASLRGNLQIVELLLQKKARVDPVDVFGVTALMQASWAGHTDIVEALISSGANLDLQSTIDIPRLKTKGVNALIGACMSGNTDVVKLLLARGVKVNTQDAEGRTALIYAAKNGYFDVAELLLSQGAKTEIKDQFGRTAITIATINGHADVVQTARRSRGKREHQGRKQYETDRVCFRPGSGRNLRDTEVGHVEEAADGGKLLQTRALAAASGSRVFSRHKGHSALHLRTCERRYRSDPLGCRFT